MNQAALEAYLIKLPNVTSAQNWGYTLFFYGDDRITPFVSIADSDNDFDSVSNLTRKGVFRVNIGVSSNLYEKLFTNHSTEADYTSLNTFMPHPHYSAQKFICILCPEGSQLQRTLEFIQEAHQIAKARSEKRRLA